jgi:hypothetical protein
MTAQVDHFNAVPETVSLEMLHGIAHDDHGIFAWVLESVVEGIVNDMNNVTDGDPFYNHFTWDEALEDDFRQAIREHRMDVLLIDGTPVGYMIRDLDMKTRRGCVPAVYLLKVLNDEWADCTLESLAERMALA